MNNNVVNMANIEAQRRINKADEGGAFDLDEDIEEAMTGPLVAAAPGHYLILSDYHPTYRMPVLAWRIGKRIILPVNCQGTWEGESVIEYPDGVVRKHLIGGGWPLPEYKNLAEYLSSEETAPDQSREAEFYHPENQKAK